MRLEMLSALTPLNYFPEAAIFEASGSRAAPRLVARIESTNTAATKAEADRYSTPPKYEPVALLKKPTTYGPAQPPRFPSELISPIDAAAAVPVRKLPGSAQKPGR